MLFCIAQFLKQFCTAFISKVCPEKTLQLSYSQTIFGNEYVFKCTRLNYLEHCPNYSATPSSICLHRLLKLKSESESEIWPPWILNSLRGNSAATSVHFTRPVTWSATTGVGAVLMLLPLIQSLTLNPFPLYQMVDHVSQFSEVLAVHQWSHERRAGEPSLGPQDSWGVYFAKSQQGSRRVPHWFRAWHFLFHLILAR